MQDRQRIKKNPKNVVQPEIPGLGAMPGTNQAAYETAKENGRFLARCSR